MSDSKAAPTANPKPIHAPQIDFETRKNDLLIGGSSASELLKTNGGRPLYAYDGAVVSRYVARLRLALPPRVKVHYAVKANPMLALVEHVARETHGLDVASGRELSLALDCGVAPRNISFAGPGKSIEDLEAGVDAGVIMVIESETEGLRLAELAAATGQRIPCAIRVNPDFEIKASGMKMGGGAQPFGVDAEQVPALIETLGQHSLDILGFHIFSGSQNLSSNAIIEGQRKTLLLAARLAQHLREGLRWLNIGGGLGVPYFPGDHPLELGEIMEGLAGTLDVHADVIGEAEIVMELGRYLVAAAGVYLCAVTDKKVSRGTTYLITNGGLHHHLAVTGNFGQVIRRNYPVAVANRMGAEGREDLETVTIVGPLCTPLDLLAKDMELPRAEIGDVIAIFMSGAYGYSASPHGFLSHPPPAEVFL